MRRNRPVTVCGEMAADPLGALALAALGVDSLSVPVNQFAAARQALAAVDPTNAAGVAHAVIAATHRRSP